MKPRIALCLFLATPGVFADTSENFDAPGSTNVINNQSGAAATITNTSHTSNYLRLLNNTGGQQNQISFALTDPGAWSNLDLSLDLRTGTTANSANADGIGLVFLPTVSYGSAASAVTSFTAESPSLAGTLSVGLDFYPNVNNVDVYWDGRLAGRRVLGNNSFLENGSFNNLTFQTEQVGNGGNMTVQNGGTLIFKTALPLWQPYESRLQISGRTGGAFMTADIDNIAGTFTGSPTTPTTLSTSTLSQNFDALGTTNWTQANDWPLPNNTLRGPEMMAAEAGSDGAFLRLVHDGVNSLTNRIAFDRATDGGVGTSKTLDFRFRAGGVGDTADGFGVLFLPTSIHANSGGGIASSEEPNHVGILGVGFDLHNNGGADSANSISLHWDGSTIVNVPVPGGINMEDNSWRDVNITSQSVAGGAQVSVSIGGTPVITNQFVNGFVPHDYRVQFAGRTGGLDGNVDLDNIVSGRAPLPATLGVITQDFDGGGHEFKAFDNNAQDGNLATNHPAILTGGPTGNFLRLAHAKNNQNPIASFAPFVPNPLVGTDLLKANFDFRMTSDAGSERADGFGFGLFNTATYGTADDAFFGNSPNWERPAFADALAFGIDIYDGNPATTLDTLTVYWNGIAIGTNNFTGFDLNSDEFHRYTIEATPQPGNTGNTLLDVILFEDVTGASYTIFDDLLVSGLDLGTYSFRPIFGARTGGFNTIVDIDNFQLVLAPEPGRSLLLAMALGLLALRRRRRAA